MSVGATNRVGIARRDAEGPRLAGVAQRRVALPFLFNVQLILGDGLGRLLSLTDDDVARRVIDFGAVAFTNLTQIVQVVGLPVTPNVPGDPSPIEAHGTRSRPVSVAPPGHLTALRFPSLRSQHHRCELHRDDHL